MSQHIVFTGNGSHDGRRVDRSIWTMLANAMGFQVRGSVCVNTRYLVASRSDTVKARDARGLGVEVVSYLDFLARARTQLGWNVVDATLAQVPQRRTDPPARFAAPGPNMLAQQARQWSSNTTAPERPRPNDPAKPVNAFVASNRAMSL